MIIWASCVYTCQQLPWILLDCTAEMSIPLCYACLACVVYALAASACLFSWASDAPDASLCRGRASSEGQRSKKARSWNREGGIWDLLGKAAKLKTLRGICHRGRKEDQMWSKTNKWVQKTTQRASQSLWVQMWVGDNNWQIREGWSLRSESRLLRTSLSTKMAQSIIHVSKQVPDTERQRTFVVLHPGTMWLKHVVLII